MFLDDDGKPMKSGGKTQSCFHEPDPILSNVPLNVNDPSGHDAIKTNVDPTADSTTKLVSYASATSSETRNTKTNFHPLKS